MVKEKQIVLLSEVDLYIKSTLLIENLKICSFVHKKAMLLFGMCEFVH